ncbi:PQQ-binding-like beta-propeller repeat protein [Streptomyces aidingensis]|uniref:Serine/threonine protein kinase n=1 Tax=Streptomyces aidingensis TaxID=910347 RepID=A0A1I1EDQ4_9ACTN|nr:serine/threonine-protein kinase [Streptomyces aidingensis]SFB84722.1 Serine/threonine protein kinase [Streptomyces aidingensis]
MEQLSRQDPHTVGEFRLLAFLGEGGFGRVYLGRSRSGTLAAVKVAHPHIVADPESRARFEREMTAVRRVSGWYTAALIAGDVHDGRPWFAIEFVPSLSLHQIVARHGPLPPRAVWWIADGIAEALVSIHRAGLLHRDLKPANVLVAPDGVRVIDFGIAKLLDSGSHTRKGAMIGTLGYMPREQLDTRTVRQPGDVYSLAATVLYAATGHPPFTGATWKDVFGQLVAAAPPDLSGLPPEFGELLRACLSHEPERRPSPAEVLTTARQRMRLPPGGDGTAVLPDAVLHALRARRREALALGRGTLGPHGTLPLPEAVRTTPVRRSWRCRLPDTPSAPLVADGVLYVTHAGRQLCAVDVRTKAELWTRPAGCAQPTAPAAAGRLLLVGGARGLLVAHDRDGGERRWSRRLGEETVRRPVVSGGTVYASTGDGLVYALDPADGTTRWRFATGGGAASPVTDDGAGTLWLGDAAGRLHALEAATGRRLWSRAVGGAVESAPAVHGGTVYAGGADMCVHAVDARTGAPRWQHHTGGPVRSSPLAPPGTGTVYAGSTDGGIYALDAAHGGVRWRYRTGGAVRCSPALGGDEGALTLYTGSLDGRLYAMAPDSGVVRWRFRTGGWVTQSPVLAGGYVHVSSQDGHVYALDAAVGAGPEAGA